MNVKGERGILIVEDDNEWQEIIAEAIQDVLHDIGREMDYVVMRAEDEQQALDLLKRHKFTFVSMDINLSGVTAGTSEGPGLLERLAYRLLHHRHKVTEGTSEGMGLLGRLEASTSDTWSIIVSGEDKDKYMQDAFEKYNILRFFEKAHWGSRMRQELQTTVKGTLLYTDPLIHLEAGDWERANDSWKKACEFAPELRKRFTYVGVLVEKATDRITGLPTGEMVDSRLKALLSTDKSWGLLYVEVDNLEEYYRTYGHIVGDSALKTVACFLRDQAGRANFVGYIDRRLFIIVVEDHLRAQSLRTRLLDGFRGIYSHLYPFQDLDNGIVKTGVPELRLVIRLMSDQDGPFADIREISRTGSGSGSRH